MRLSICIPTWNREPHLRGALESIASQSPPSDVEVVVSDNASTDNTQTMVESFRSRLPALTYRQMPENMGADRNYLKAVELASGAYIWLLGSDDQIAPGGIASMLRRIDTHDCGVYLCTRMECDYHMRPVAQGRWLLDSSADRVFDTSSRDGLLAYFAAAGGIGALFSYLSAIVIRKSLWDAAPYDERFTGTLYSHVYKIMGALKAGCRLEFIAAPLVLCRGGNDSFKTGGEFRRFMVDINGYLALASGLFQEDKELQKAFLAVLVRGHKLYALKIMALASNAEWGDMAPKLAACGFPRWLRVCAPAVRLLRLPLRLPIYGIGLLRRRGLIP